MTILGEYALTDIIIICIGLITTFYAFVKWRYGYWARSGVPYLNPSFPFGNLGDTFLRKLTIGLKIQQVYKEFKENGHKFGGIYVFATPRLILTDLDLIKSILTTDFNHFVDRGLYVNEKDDPLSAHLVNLGGQKWRNLRQKLTPTFTSGKLKMMFQTLVDCSEGLVVLMDEFTKNEEPIDIKEILGRFTTDIIGPCAFGLECNSLKDPEAEFRKYGRKVFQKSYVQHLKRGFIETNKTLALKLGLAVTDNEASKFFLKAVKDTVEYRETNNITRKDFMQILIDLKNAEKSDTTEVRPTLTVTELAAQAFVFFLAGFETSSTAMTFALFELARNQEIQQKAREEVSQVLQKYDGKVSYDAIMEMHYVEQVINEALRKYPPFPIINRVCTEDYKIPDSKVILKEGTNLSIPVYGIHHDPDYYPNPEKFDPERFSENHKSSRHNFAYIPFGEGPRICIALRFGMMQTKMGLAVLLKNYNFTLHSKTKTPIKFEPKELILSTDGGVWLTSTKI